MIVGPVMVRVISSLGACRARLAFSGSVAVRYVRAMWRLSAALPVGFVLGMEQRERLGFVPGAKAELVARKLCFAEKDTASAEEDGPRFHD